VPQILARLRAEGARFVSIDAVDDRP
jgi:hypothetical protein